MRADELLEGRDLLRLGIEEADDRDVAHVVDGVEAPERGDGVLTVDGERVLALDAVLLDEVDAVPADADEAVLAAERTMRTPMPGWLASASTRSG